MLWCRRCKKLIDQPLRRLGLHDCPKCLGVACAEPVGGRTMFKCAACERETTPGLLDMHNGRCANGCADGRFIREEGG